MDLAAFHILKGVFFTMTKHWVRSFLSLLKVFPKHFSKLKKFKLMCWTFLVGRWRLPMVALLLGWGIFREHPQHFPGLRLSGSWLCARECVQRWSTSMNPPCYVFVLIVENGDPSLRGACVGKLCNTGYHGLRICPKAKFKKASQLNKHTKWTSCTHPTPPCHTLIFYCNFIRRQCVLKLTNAIIQVKYNRFSLLKSSFCQL